MEIKIIEAFSEARKNVGFFDFKRKLLLGHIYYNIIIRNLHEYKYVKCIDMTNSGDAVSYKEINFLKWSNYMIKFLQTISNMSNEQLEISLRDY